MSNPWIIYFCGPGNRDVDKISPVFLSLNSILRLLSVIEFITYHGITRGWSVSSNSLIPASDILVEVASQKPSLLYLPIIRLVCGCITFTSTSGPCEFDSWLGFWQAATCQQFNGRILPSSVSSSLSRKTRCGFHISKNNRAQGWFFKLKFWLWESLNIVLLLF